MKAIDYLVAVLIKYDRGCVIYGPLWMGNASGAGTPWKKHNIKNFHAAFVFMDEEHDRVGLRRYAGDTARDWRSQ